MSEPLLQVDGLQAQFVTPDGTVKAVDDVSFALDRGSVLGLLGDSGCGKSTIGYSIMGLVKPPGRVVGGRIVFDGRDLATLSVEQMRQLRGNRMAVIFKDPMHPLDPVLRIDAQMVETILAHEAIPRPGARARARELLLKVGVPSPEAVLEAYPHQCSAGVRQRVAIATAFLNRPDLIIADEPTATLDLTEQAQVVFELQRLVRDAGAALIWITRDPSVIANVASRIGVIYAGRIVELGYTEDVLHAPRHPYTRGLLDSMPGRGPPREKLRQMPGAGPSLIDLAPGCAFRPRCPYATAECGEAPELLAYGAMGQSVRCFHPLPPPG
jgi:peptide/nickel transport system ATP-binding protein